ncbi:MAG: hypothetical protein KME17_24665 [Cyanosarcina radialis HA8281-LM2]|jgi:hypothetical protein|nr:hypothetical protein [Cyanosarcina radialis HA8281-LM2]
MSDLQKVYRAIAQEVQQQLLEKYAIEPASTGKKIKSSWRLKSRLYKQSPPARTKRIKCN